MTTIAWVLALDTDLELADPEGYRPSPRALQQSKAWAQRFLANAQRYAPKGVYHKAVDHADPCDGDEVLLQAWCPTPRSHTIAARAGHRMAATPPVTVLHEANHRAFAAAFERFPSNDLAPGLPDRQFVRSIDDLEATLARTPQPQGWLLKRPLGFSGRGRKLVDGPLTNADRRWIEASMTDHGSGLLVEPFVTITREVALHAWLGQDGTASLGRPTRLVSDTDGTWIDNLPVGDQLGAQEGSMLSAAAHLAAARLHSIGYFGPFGIDAYRYLDRSGEERFEPLGELNARYSMGWFVGFDDQQDLWLQLLRECSHGPTT